MKPESDFSYAPEGVKNEWNEVYNRIDEAPKAKAEEWEHLTPEFIDTRSGELDMKRIAESIDAQQNLAREAVLGQAEGSIKIDSNLPVTVFMVGDIHSGSIFTNEKLWNEHRNEILRTPGAYVLFLHNLVDNGMPGKFPNNIMNNTMQPHMQFEYMQAQIKELDKAGKVLGAIEGDCHEGWSWQVAGINASALLYGYKERNFPILENGAILNLEVGRETYRIGLWHKQGPFNSNFNKSHSLLQNRRLQDRRTDVEVGAHYHNSEANNTWVGRSGQQDKLALIKTGTYKGVWGGENPLHDRWLVDRWGASGENPGNSVILYPFQHDVEASLGFETSIRKHQAIRTALFLEQIGEMTKLQELIAGI